MDQFLLLLFTMTQLLLMLFLSHPTHRDHIDNLEML
jgi:hypothetical protein